MGIVGTLLVLLWLLLRSSFSSNQVAETHVSKIANVVKSAVVCCGGNRLSSPTPLRVLSTKISLVVCSFVT